jgi:hypothetical protein
MGRQAWLRLANYRMFSLSVRVGCQCGVGEYCALADSSQLLGFCSVIWLVLASEHFFMEL